MAIKGTTKIQLFDARTGELTDEIVKENMVTNAVPNILNPALQMFMAEGTDICVAGFLRRCSPIGKQLFGGILVFSEPLEEDVNNIIPSVQARNSIIGYAGQFSSVVGNTMKGTYNATESIELDNGFTHVWDFSTDQANGEIAAVALTSAMGGDCGWNATERSANRGNFLIPITSKDFTTESKDISTVTFFNSEYTIIKDTIFSDEDYRYQNALVTNGKYAMLLGLKHNDDDSTLSIKYVVKNLSNDITLNQRISNEYFDTYNIGKTVEGEWSSSVIGVSYKPGLTRTQVRDNVCKCCFRSTDSPIGGNAPTLTFVDFVLNDDGTVTIKDPVSVTINADAILTVVAAEADDFTDTAYQRSLAEAGYAYYTDEYAYLQTERYNGGGTGSYFVRVSLSNPTDIKIFKKPNGSTKTFTIGVFQGEFILTDKTNVYRTSDFITYYKVDGFVQDASYQYVYRDHSFTPMKAPYIGIHTEQVQAAYNHSTYGVLPCLITPYLATINNLDSVVAKTSSKTMKITYTIQNV